MADYSIGDKVEVMWKAELFDAEVIHVHPSGMVDVMYDIDGNKGFYLTVKEHGLKLLPDENEKKQPANAGGGGKKKKKTTKKKKKKEACSTDGCSTNVHARGLCATHCKMKPYSVDSCTTKVVARGLCGKHGALGSRRHEPRRAAGTDAWLHDRKHYRWLVALRKRREKKKQ